MCIMSTNFNFFNLGFSIFEKVSSNFIIWKCRNSDKPQNPELEIKIEFL